MKTGTNELQMLLGSYQLFLFFQKCTYCIILANNSLKYYKMIGGHWKDIAIFQMFMVCLSREISRKTIEHNMEDLMITIQFQSLTKCVDIVINIWHSHCFNINCH